jgi:hypothetical protein
MKNTERGREFLAIVEIVKRYTIRSWCEGIRGKRAHYGRKVAPLWELS